MTESKPITIDAQQAMVMFQQLYPTEFAHVMATLEAAYWKAQATKADDEPTT